MINTLTPGMPCDFNKKLIYKKMEDILMKQILEQYLNNSHHLVGDEIVTLLTKINNDIATWPLNVNDRNRLKAQLIADQNNAELLYSTKQAAKINALTNEILNRL